MASKKNKNSHLYYIATDHEKKLIEHAEIQIRKQVNRWQKAHNEGDELAFANMWNGCYWCCCFSPFSDRSSCQLPVHVFSGL